MRQYSAPTNRKKDRDKSSFDWNEAFRILNMVREEIAENFPYKVIHIDGCEADDIIGTLCHEFGRELNNGEPILILSGDKDFVQLQKYANISQYDPVRKKWVKNSTPEMFLIEHILAGDRGDGIPNVLSDDNVFVENRRQKPLSKKKLKGWIDDIFFYNTFTEEEEKNYR